MIDIRFAEKSDIPFLKQLWKLSFGDSDDFIDFYFNERFSKNNILLLTYDGAVASMLTIIDVSLNAIYKTTMLYALATHPDYRGKGLASKLMDAYNDYLISNQYNFSVLVPAEDSLFDYYAKVGYREGFIIREALLTHEDMNNPNDIFSCNIQPCDAADYNEIRNNHLAKTKHIRYGKKEVEYQKKISVFSGGDIYSLDFGNIKGCAAIETGRDTVVIKELLVPDKFINSALLQISMIFKAGRYLLRTPACSSGNLNGNIRRFGMVKELIKSGCSINSDGYLGLAFD